MREVLDHSQISLIWRTILSVGKDPRDPSVWAEYEEGYRRMQKVLHFSECQPASSVPQ
jgi:hypothetical protein